MKTKLRGQESVFFFKFNMFNSMKINNFTIYIREKKNEGSSFTNLEVKSLKNYLFFIFFILFRGDELSPIFSIYYIKKNKKK